MITMLVSNGWIAVMYGTHKCSVYYKHNSACYESKYSVMCMVNEHLVLNVHMKKLSCYIHIIMSTEANV